MSTLTEIVIALDGLEPEALEVLLDIAKRLKAGQAEYGTMDVCGDGRDYDHEIDEECIDVVVYAAMDRLRRRKSKPKSVSDVVERRCLHCDTPISALDIYCYECE